MIRYTQGDGTSKGKAIKITGARTNFEGVDAEYALIRRDFKIIQKKWKLLFQELIHDNKYSFDRLVLRDENGKVSEIWFDISNFFGIW